MSIPVHSNFTAPKCSAQASTLNNSPTIAPNKTNDANHPDSLRLRRKVDLYLDLRVITKKSPLSKAVLKTSEMRRRL